MKKGQLAIIHLAKKQVGMTDEEYRDLLSSVGVDSSKDLGRKGFSILMNHFEQLGFVSKSKYRANAGPDEKRGYLDKIDAILAELELDRAYVDGIAKERFGCQKCHWLEVYQLRKVMQMLIYHQRRISGRRRA